MPQVGNLFWEDVSSAHRAPACGPLSVLSRHSIDLLTVPSPDKGRNARPKLSYGDKGGNKGWLRRSASFAALATVIYAGPNAAMGVPFTRTEQKDRLVLDRRVMGRMKRSARKARGSRQQTTRCLAKRLGPSCTRLEQTPEVVATIKLDAHVHDGAITAFAPPHDALHSLARIHSLHFHQLTDVDRETGPDRRSVLADFHDRRLFRMSLTGRFTI